MLLWLQANIGTIIVGAILLCVVGLSIRKLINDKRKGNSSCGCGCSNCAMKGKCHK
jgi:hypothetical protein